MGHGFASFHPLVNALWFGLVLALTMLLTHPAVQLISLASALVCAGQVWGKNSLRRTALCLVPAMAMAALLNPLFSHQGATILTCLPGGNPLTLESILYGLSAGVSLGAVLLWFRYFAGVMTTEKLICLSGKAIPALSLVLSMALRFLPRFRLQLRAVVQAQRGLGRDISQGSIPQRVRQGTAILSILITWALEDAIETADSMRGRGYGLPGRTAYSPFLLDGRDRLALAWLGFCGFFLLSGTLAGGLRWRYYPTPAGPPLTPMTGLMLLCQLALCLTPAAIHWKEARLWRRSRSVT